MLNLPITETFAIRLNAGWTDDAGFINQPNLYQLDASGVPLSSQPLTPANPVGVNPAIPPAKWSKDGVNTYEYRNVRLAALWKPNDDFKAQLSYYYQRAAAGGFPYVATQSAAYNQSISPNTQLPGTNLIPQLYNSPVPGGAGRLSSATNSLEGTNDSVNLVALEADYDLGFATLTSSSSWARHDNATDADLTALYTNFYFYQNFYGQNPRSFVQGHDRYDDKVWTQEFRLASKSGGLFDWVGGLFYKDEKTFIQEHEYYPGYDDFYANCPQTVPSDAGGVNGSTCGLGEYYRHRRDQCRRHPPVPRSSLYRRFRNTLQGPRRLWRVDLARHYRLECYGRNARVQADSRPGAADRSAVRRTGIRRERGVER